MIAKLSEDSTRQVSHPTRAGLVEPGETFECDATWAKQHKPLVDSGELEIQHVHNDTTLQCAGTTKAGKPCKRKPLDGTAYCKAHTD